MTSVPSLDLADLTIRLQGGPTIVENVDLRIAPGEILGLVGESGSGKSTSALSILGYSAPGVEIASGSLTIAGRRLPMSDEMRSARGPLVACVPQNPGSALNPSARVAEAIEEMLAAHGGGDDDPGFERVLGAVGLPATEEFRARYPHQLSGGQQQRLCIAVALSCNPDLLVLDEPTTGLDVITQAHLLHELQLLREEKGVAMLYVTHDLSVVAQIADRIAVMYAGRIVEEGPAEEVLRRPRHPYTWGLLASIPDHVRPKAIHTMPGVAAGPGDRGGGCAFAPRCPQSVDSCKEAMPMLEPVSQAQAVRCFEWKRTPAPIYFAPESSDGSGGTDAPVALEVSHLRAEHHGRRETVVAAADVSFVLRRAGSVALVGESGSGKTTIARAIAGLHPIAGGQVSLEGERLADLVHRRSVEQRRSLQLIFQNPAEALNPQHTIRRSLVRPARTLRGLRGEELQDEVGQLLERVRLPLRMGERYPSELSGGELQRVSIARALAARPKVLICDEITSALDVSVQAAVLELLADLRRDLGVGIVFITHDLGVVSQVADTVLVLEAGVVCEQGPTDSVLNAPSHAYSRRLLAAAPSLSAVMGEHQAHSRSPLSQ